MKNKVIKGVADKGKPFIRTSKKGMYAQCAILEPCEKHKIWQVEEQKVLSEGSLDKSTNINLRHVKTKCLVIEAESKTNVELLILQ